MENKLFAVFEDPNSKTTLQYINDNGMEFLQAMGSERYVIENGIVRFLQNDELTGNNKRYQKLYDRLAPIYDLTTNMYALLKNGSEKARTMEYLNVLDVKDADKVIEISIGTGRNIKYLNPNAQYFGVDISLGMLNRCRKAMKKIKRPIILIQAEAESIPLRDNTFDVVFSAGGFNFYNNKQKAVLEMLRIAKSGTKLMIYDETEKVRAKLDKAPVAGSFYKQDEIKNPAEFVPEWCKDIQYKEICDRELYVLTFCKP